MINRIAHYTGIIGCIALIGVCFLPWTYYHSINETFTGFYVKQFSTGTYYGKAGAVLSVMAVLVMLLMLLRKSAASKINLFLSAVMVAYAVRTYIIFTGSLFEGEVVVYAGMYLMVALSFLILLCTVFPDYKENKKEKQVPSNADNA